ncbi:M13 family metallopeptidase [bacterium]|nr:M13 family metallopeptidase [bacterium]
MKAITFALLATLTLVSCSKRTVQSTPLPKPVVPVTPPAVVPSSDIPDRREFPIAEDVAPCDNFYEYACSRVDASFKLRDDRSRHAFAFNDSFERLLTQKLKFLEGLGSRKDLSPRTQQLQATFLACLDVPARVNEEKKLVQDELGKLAAITTRAQLGDMLSRNILSPETSLVGIEPDPNLADPLQNDIVFRASLMSLPSKQNYDSEDVRKDFQALVELFFQIVDPDNAADRAKNLVALEASFAKLTPEPFIARKRYADKTLSIARDEWAKRYPNLGLEAVLSRLPDSTQSRDLSVEDLTFVNEALEKEPLQTLKDVYLYRTLSGVMQDAFPVYFERKLAFENKHLGGPPKLPERSERCAQSAMKDFDKELDAEIIDQVFPGFDKPRFASLVDTVRQAIIRRLEGNTWLTKDGKDGALLKMRKARMQLVRPDNDDQWDFLPVATYDAKTPIANGKLRAFKGLEKTLAEFGVERDWRHWHRGPLTINAYYSPPDNAFVMLQGILQYPFYDQGLEDAANLGAVGVVVGHELGHGFDNNGSKYNENGAAVQWMPEADSKEFDKRTQLLVDQFGALVPKDINPNYGEFTLGENIADTSGLRFAYEAAFPGGKGSLEAKKAFYLQYARAWCAVQRPKELERRYRIDPHAQPVARVNEPLKHQPGFYEAYACKVGDKMYRAPDQRMDLW